MILSNRWTRKSSLAVALAVVLSIQGQGQVHADVKVSPPQQAGKPMSQWKNFHGKSRAQMIDQAKELITARLGKIDFQDYPEVTVWKNAKAYRVEFRAAVVQDLVNDRGNPTQDFVDVTISEQESVVTPQALPYLYQPSAEVRRMAKLFGPGEFVRLTDNGTAYEAQVSRRGKDEMSGGAEAYSIDKKTAAKKLLWHEHPQAQPKISAIVNLAPGTRDPWIEIPK